VNYRPEWDIDRRYGEHGEKIVSRILDLDAAQIEVKRKRKSDDKFYVEIAQDPGATGSYKPSGINTTRASHWAFVIGETGAVVLIPTPLLRAACHISGAHVAETDGTNPTQGCLLSLAEIVSRAVVEAAA
jgi:hypothetical protein